MPRAEVITGDCRDVLTNVVGKTITPVIVTDPPFNIGYHYRTYGDKMNDKEYYKMLSGIVKLCPTVIVLYPEQICRLSIELNEVPKRIISWIYPSNTKRQHRDIAFFGVSPDFDRVRVPYKNPNDKRIKELVKKTGGARLYDWIMENQVKNVSKEKTDHPCQMPLALMRKIVKLLPDGSTIIDPFAGSGTTGVAALIEGYDSIMIELDDKYSQIARSRIKEAEGGN